jgi:phospholipid/cholesterol/gamma-HCH transport system ATP-binding protein
MTDEIEQSRSTARSGEKGEVVIEVRDLVVTFPSETGERVRILDGLSLDVRRGETLVIMGGSGSGKSTFLNCLIGELTPDSGEIRILDESIVSASRALMNRIRTRFGILFQSGALFSSLTLAENVALPLQEHSYVEPRIIDIVVAMKLQQVRMLEHRDKLPSQLSGGQKKRGGLARAMALDPEILFFDEPSAGLDPVTSAAIDDLILGLTKNLGVTGVVVTHEMDSAFRIADRMVMLQNGRSLVQADRAYYERLRGMPIDRLEDGQEQLIRQFIDGLPQGPLTDTAGRCEYERLITAG